MKPVGNDVSLLLQQLAVDMRQAEDCIAASEAPDLGTLDGRIHVLCETVRSLPAEAASPFLPHLEQLYDAVDRLVQAIDDAGGTRIAATSAE